MPYVVNVTDTVYQSTTTATPTATLGAHQTNDVLLIALTNDGGGTTITAPAGWTMIGTQAASQGVRSAFAFKVAASGSETNPTFGGANDEWNIACIVIRDADPTTPISTVQGTDWQRVDWGNSGSISTGTAGALTTAAADALIFFLGSCDGGNDGLRMKLNDGLCLSMQGSTDFSTYNCGQVVACYQMQAAAAAPQPVFYCMTNTEGGNIWTIAIRNKSGGARQPQLRADITDVNWYGNYGATHQAVTWQANSNFSATINSITCDSTAVSTSNSQSIANSPWGTATEIRNTTSTTGAWAGATHTISSTDFTDKVFSVQWQLNTSQSYTRFGSGGVLVGFSDGTNWEVFQVLNTTIPYVVGSSDTAFIACGSGRATPYASSGTLNWAAITRIGYFWHRIGSSATQDGLYVRNAALLGNNAITGGGSTRPAAYTDVVAYLKGWQYYKLAEVQGSAQVLLKSNLQIGNAGTNTTYFDGSASSAEYPPAWSATTVPSWQMAWNVLGGSLTMSVYAGASDTINVTAGIAATSTNQAFSINASSNAGATYSFAGTSIVGYDPTWKTGIPCASATFSGCGTIDFKGTDLVNLIVRNGLDAALCLASDGFSATGCAFTATGSAIYAIRIAAAGTFDLESTTFSGFTKDIDVTATTGTVTINLADGQATPTYQTAGATVTIVSSPVLQSVEVSGILAGSRLQIYDTDASVELYNDIVAGTSHTWTDGTPAVADRAIRIRLAYVNGALAAEFIDANVGTCGTTAGSETVSYLASQVNDTTYNSNAVDGSTVTDITFTDAATDLVVCNLAGGSTTWPRIYAAFVYWLFTALGIDDDVTYIEAPDTANYLLTAMKVRNASATPLTITSGYGRSATTGLVADIIDVAGSTGNIYPQPDHVVPYQTTGTYAITGDITTVLTAIGTVPAAVLTAAEASPIAASVEQVLGEGIEGDGTDENPWGPAS